MEIIHSPQEMTAWANRTRAAGQRIALVPTMGAFHEVHLRLMRTAAGHADRVVVSLFVNPIQFGPQEDFDRYPRDLARDAALAANVKVDILFAPSPQQMYPQGSGTTTKVVVSGLTDTLCGRSRPGHFDGVTTVVAKLFNIVKPNLAIFGRKDFQQLAVIGKMVRDLNWDIEIVGHPIVREADGLAMSSRNAYLTDTERQSGLALSKGMQQARQRVRAGVTSAGQLIEETEKILLGHPGVAIDYVNIVHRLTLLDQTEINRDSVLLVAARVGTTRLIDNTVLFDEQ